MRISDWSSNVCSSDLYFNYNFSPITAEDGRIEGVFNAGLETTPRVVASRHQRVLIDLIAETASATSVEEAFAGAIGPGRSPRGVSLRRAVPPRRRRGPPRRQHGRVPGEIGRASCRDRVCQYV